MRFGKSRTRSALARRRPGKVSIAFAMVGAVTVAPAATSQVVGYNAHIQIVPVTEE